MHQAGKLFNASVQWSALNAFGARTRGDGSEAAGRVGAMLATTGGTPLARAPKNKASCLWQPAPRTRLPSCTSSQVGRISAESLE